MVQITNEKVASLDPTWAPFAGFSLLFDNPGSHFSKQSGPNLLDIAPAPGGSLDLYARLAQALDGGVREELVQKCQFCPLPPSSYHVTAWDGINLSNIESIHPSQRNHWKSFLRNIPDSLKAPPPAMRIASGSNLAKWSSGITFSFRNLALFNDQALVALLEPRGSESAANFEAFLQARTILSNEAAEAIGLDCSKSYSPHVSLGYFAGKCGGRAAQARINDWNIHFKQSVRTPQITFDSISVYAFRDMARFYKSQ